VTRILIADNHEVVRSGLRTILQMNTNWQVVAEACDGKEAVSKALETKPDIAILDYSLPLLSSLRVTQRIRVRLPETEVLIFSTHVSETLVHDILQAGARGYLLKSDANSILIEAVESLAAHKTFFTANVSETLLLSFIERRKRRASPLTDRGRAILQLIAEGHTNRQIAHTLSISVKTVETHRAAIMRKLRLSSSAALVRYAIRNRLVDA
jgi:DNA-binding NarL/FixJ family response regulator